MRLRQRALEPALSAGIAASGAFAITPNSGTFAWLPSTWPPAPVPIDSAFVDTLANIFRAGMLEEIQNVIDDAFASGGSLEHRGHVVAVAMMCALDSLSCFASKAKKQKVRIANFVQNFFPMEFHEFAEDIYLGFRNGLVHEWFLTRVVFLPDEEPITREDGKPVSMGLLTFQRGLEQSVSGFVDTLRSDPFLCRIASARYESLRKTVQS